SDAGNGRLKNERALLGKALDDVQGIVEPMVGWALASMENPKELYKVGLNATRLLMALGDLIVGWLLCRQAEVALTALGRGDVSDSDKAFYTGKVAAAQFFCQTVLPRLAADRATTEATTLDLMELPEEALSPPPAASRAGPAGRTPAPAPARAGGRGAPAARPAGGAPAFSGPRRRRRGAPSRRPHAAAFGETCQ